MAPPSALNIATQSVNRLVKEESYYHKEQTSQEARIKKLQDEIAANSPELDSNAPYVLKQEVRLPQNTVHETTCMQKPQTPEILDIVNPNPSTVVPLARAPELLSGNWSDDASPDDDCP